MLKELINLLQLLNSIPILLVVSIITKLTNSANEFYKMVLSIRLEKLNNQKTDF